MVAPIWHNPAWVTAIVGVVSAFLTIPEVVSDYLTREQDIEQQRLLNANSKLEQEFSVVNTTLAQQGTERIFVLRYLARTLDDEDARSWAEEEVKRLDRIAELETQIRTQAAELIKLQAAPPPSPTAGAGSGAGEGHAEAARESELTAGVASTANELRQLLQQSGIPATTSPHLAEGEVTRPISRIILAPIQSNATVAAMRDISTDLGWADIGANYFIDMAGETNRGRPLERIPAILRGYNTASVGIFVACPAWTGTSGMPDDCRYTRDQLQALDSLVAELSARYDISPGEIYERADLADRYQASGIRQQLEAFRQSRQAARAADTSRETLP